MNGKRFIFILSLIILAIFVSSAVSAHEFNATAEAETAGDNHFEVTQEDTISKNHKVSGNTFGDIQSTLNSAGDGDVIELSGTYTGSGSSISIGKSVTIAGKNDATLDAKGLSGIFKINKENIIIKDIKFINTNEKAIDSTKGNSQIINCEFVNCNSDRYTGALVLWHDSKVVKSRFINCTAEIGAGAVYGGNIEDCTFINCHAGKYGGAIEGAASVMNSTFTNCSVGEHGRIVEDSLCEGCIFIGCVAEWGSIANANNSAFISCNGSIGGHSNCLILNYMDDLSKYEGLTGFIVNGNKFEDIQKALNQAYRGDTIHLFGKYTGSEYISIPQSELRILGHEATLDGRDEHTIFRYGSERYEQDITFENLRLVNAATAIDIPGQCRGNRIINTTFENCGFAISGNIATTTDNTAIGCRFIDCGWATDYTDVTDCNFTGCNVGVTDGKVVNSRFTDCNEAITDSDNVTGCTFIDCWKEGTVKDSKIYASTFIDCYDNPVDGGSAYYCIFKDTDQSPHVTDYYRHAKLTLTQTGTYYQDKTLKVKLTDTDSNIPAYDAQLRVKFSNGKTVTLKTNRNGIATYKIPFNPGTYSASASVVDTKIDCKEASISGIRIVKAPCTLSAKKKTVTYKTKNTFSAKLTNSKTKKALSKVNLIIKVYTGKKYRTFKVKTNSKGLASIQTSDISVGTHKVVISSKDTQISLKAKTTYIVVKKPVVKVTSIGKVYVDGFTMKGKKIVLKDRKSNKALVGTKVRFKILTSGKSYKTYTLKTGKNGVCAIATTKFSAGSHKLIVSSADKNIRFTLKTNIWVDKILINGGYRTVAISAGRVILY